MPGTSVSLFEREDIAVALTEDRSTSWAEIARKARHHRDHNADGTMNLPAFSSQIWDLVTVSQVPDRP
jgi:hypothetical protein